MVVELKESGSIGFLRSFEAQSKVIIIVYKPMECSEELSQLTALSAPSFERIPTSFDMIFPEKTVSQRDAFSCIFVSWVGRGWKEKTSLILVHFKTHPAQPLA